MKADNIDGGALGILRNAKPLLSKQQFKTLRGQILAGDPSGSRDRTSKQERNYIKKEELERKLDDMYAEENRKREEIEALIECMESPDEQTAIEMHYIDGAKWRDVSVVLYGDEPDYDENEQRYLKRTFKIHGSALQTLARIYKEQKEQNEK